MRASAVARVVGLDPSAESLRRAAPHAQAGGLKIDDRPPGVEEVVLRDAAGFDLVSCTEVREHVPDPKVLILHLCRMVKPGGHVFVSIMNRTVRSYLFAVLAAEWILHFAPRGAHRWDRFLRPAKVAAWGREAELTEVTRQGMFSDPLTKRFFRHRAWRSMIIFSL